MLIRSENVGKREHVWSDATGDLISDEVVEHYLEGSERPMSRTTAKEAENESGRLTMEWLLGLAQGGYSLYYCTEESWPDMHEEALYTFDGAEDGMTEGMGGETLQSFVAYMKNREWPAKFPGHGGGSWLRVVVYNARDECECPWCGTGTGNEDSRDGCQLCEGDGLLYDPYHTIATYYLSEADCDECGETYTPAEGDDGCCSEDCRSDYLADLHGEEE